VFTRRVEAIPASPTSGTAAIAKKMAAEGRDIVHLAHGEPGFPTPAHVKEAAIRAIRADTTGYPPVAGTAPLKAAVVEKYRRDQGLAFEPDQIIVSAGCKQVLYNALSALVEPGAEVVLPVPSWVSYESMVALAGGTVVPLVTSESHGFAPTTDALAAAITPATRVVLLNSPGNPTGCLLSADRLRALGDVLLRHPRVWIVFDGAYEHMVFDGQRAPCLPELVPALSSRTLLVHGVSKSYSMTGWRVGWGAGPRALVAAMARIQSHTTSAACAISQAAAEAALTGPQDCLAEFRAALQARRDLLRTGLLGCPGIEVPPASGALFLFPRCTALFGRRSPGGVELVDDVAVARALLEEEGVAVVPGTPFGGPGHLRFCFAAEPAELEEAAARVARFSAEVLRT
jgi:aspartate aminotransferase